MEVPAPIHKVATVWPKPRIVKVASMFSRAEAGILPDFESGHTVARMNIKFFSSSFSGLNEATRFSRAEAGILENRKTPDFESGHTVARMNIIFFSSSFSRQYTCSLENRNNR